MKPKIDFTKQQIARLKAKVFDFEQQNQNAYD
jgi:hypothetical protein